MSRNLVALLAASSLLLSGCVGPFDPTQEKQLEAAVAYAEAWAQGNDALRDVEFSYWRNAPDSIGKPDRWIRATGPLHVGDAAEFFDVLSQLHFEQQIFRERFEVDSIKPSLRADLEPTVFSWADQTRSREETQHLELLSDPAAAEVELSPMYDGRAIVRRQAGVDDGAAGQYLDRAVAHADEYPAFGLFADFSFHGFPGAETYSLQRGEAPLQVSYQAAREIAGRVPSLRVQNINVAGGQCRHVSLKTDATADKLNPAELAALGEAIRASGGQGCSVSLETGDGAWASTKVGAPADAEPRDEFERWFREMVG